MSDDRSMEESGDQSKAEAVPATEVIVPGQDLVVQILERMELKYIRDDEGDLVAPWEKFRIYLMFRGEADQRVYAVRAFYDHGYDTDMKPRLCEVIDDWNRKTLWPKVYTDTQDDAVRLVGEASMVIGGGVAREHFVSSTVAFVRASIEFNKWISRELEPAD